ncbi:MAG: GNAT family N-acetyltransferase [Bacteroides sp.]|nr:GNAT family N-acetyltransferase [Bacteroides sp.]
MEITIREAEKEDAPFIGNAITMAIGDELAAELGGPDHNVEDVENLFISLARRKDSQYSYLNSLVAEDERGNVAGVIVSYDGAKLRKLRKSFFNEARIAIGLDIDIDNLDNVTDETGPEEYYLDSLAVFPDYRGNGIAAQLIDEASKKADLCGKPAGLLCSKTNDKARRLYERIGFRPVGERYFAGELMDHLMREKGNK